MLEVRNLHARVVGGDEEILKGLDLTVNRGEVHAIMGPNGSGKSTFANVLAGRPDYEVTDGEILYDGERILGLPSDERARRGMFLAFQYPAEIPGVRPWQFLKAAMDAAMEHRGEEKLSVRAFSKLFDSRVEQVGINPSLMKRSLNEGFSGGEKKRNEMLQLAVLEPALAILDETDSGLDVDALKIVADGVNSLRSPERAFVIVTHYQRLLNHITPDYVHILVRGRIVKSGGPDLALEVERTGYEDFIKATAGT
ncbi:MAG: Fe-S cluster assembly ATPase SufC [Dehalococcoidia bacterium]